LSEAGYNSSHVGKWHQGDIEQSYPHNQGFDFASFHMHNQATFNFITKESETIGLPQSISHTIEETPYVLVANFRPKSCVLGVDAEKGGKPKNEV
jgi:arylsulfatase A-like enzyme